MKFIWSLIFSVVLTFMFGLQLVFAQDDEVSLELGERIFTANCAACHAGGQNSVVANKTLQIEALEQYSKDTVTAIVTQVTNGNGAMPAFGGRLEDNEIESVANYVLNQAKNKSW